MKPTVQDQLHEYCAYLQSELDGLGEKELANAPLQLQESPEVRRPGWIVAIGVATAVLALVAIAALAINAIDRSSTQTTLVPAVTITTDVVTTEPEAPEPLVLDSGSALDAGWTQVDVGGARFHEYTLDYPGRLGEVNHLRDTPWHVLGYVDSGLAMRNLDGELLVVGGQGEIELSLDVFGDRQVYELVARAGTLWAHVDDGAVGFDQNSELWVLGEQGTWSPVMVHTPDGLAPPPSGDELFDALGHMRFLEMADRIVAISGFDGLIGASSDGGRTFTVGHFPDAPDEVGFGVGRAWATNEGFFVERRGFLWQSRDGLTWSETAEITGLPDWDVGISGMSPESFVAGFEDGSLWTMEFDWENKGLFRSVDGGITWSLVPGPYPFADVSGPMTSQGWLHFSENERVWVSDDGYDWYWIDGLSDNLAQPASGVVLTQGGEVVSPPGSPLVSE